MGGERLMSVISVSEHCVCPNISKARDLQVNDRGMQPIPIKRAKRPERRNS